MRGAVEGRRRRSALGGDARRLYALRVELILLTAALVLVMGLVLLPLARSWVRSSHAGGYRMTHGPDGVEEGPKVPEDDETRWHWPDAKPEP